MTSPCNYLGNFSPISIGGVNHGRKLQLGDHLDVKLGLENCSVCDPFAHAPLKELGGGNVWMPQKYTSSQHGNKCLEEEIRSVTKVGFVSKDKASFVRKDTTGT